MIHVVRHDARVERIDTLSQIKQLFARSSITGGGVALQTTEFVQIVRADLDGDKAPDTLNFVYGSVSDDDRESLKDKRVGPDKDPDDDRFWASGWWVVTLAARPDAPFVARDIEYAAAVYYDCRDFNGDGRAEVQVLEGYETDHSVCLLELQGERLVSLGCAAGGD